MLFTSLGFFLFLPLTLLVFAALPVQQRWLWLLLASWVFYGIWQPANVLYLGAVTLLVYGCGRAMDSAGDPRWRSMCLTSGLALVLGSLFALKFYDFAAGEIERLAAQFLGQSQVALPRIGASAPAGYSFYAFSAASYLIDAYTRRLPEKTDPGGVALYLAFFPKILAGPIERGTTFLPQLRTGLHIDANTFVLGLQLIGWGLFKKVVVADNLAPLVDRNFAIAAFAAPMELLVSAYFFAFQIYCDFSGYTDIAIGVSLLVGIRLMENFRRPYLARSVSEFWSQRWHISLAQWFRDYLYIPLGGSKAGPVRTHLNVMLVFLVSGLWHAGLGYGVGWTFIVWGALNGLYLWVGLATRSFWSRIGSAMPNLGASLPILIIRLLLTFHLVGIGWIFFRAKSIADAVTILQKIATRLHEFPALLLKYPFTIEHKLGFGLILLLIAVEILDERRSIFERVTAAPVWLRWCLYYLVIFALLILGRWQAKEFIYMQF